MNLCFKSYIISCLLNMFYYISLLQCHNNGVLNLQAKVCKATRISQKFCNILVCACLLCKYYMIEAV